MQRCIVGRGTALMVALSLAVFTACSDDEPTGPGNGGGGGGGGTPTMTDMVNVDDNVFVPDFIQVSPSDTVTWTWVGSNRHNVTFASSSIANSVTQTTGTYETDMPATAGDYAYECTIHANMTGTVRVQ